MISLAVAWVMVTIVKRAKSVEINMGIFIVTGILDFLIVVVIAAAFGGNMIK